MKTIAKILFPIFTLLLVTCDLSSGPVHFEDQVLEDAIRRSIGKTSGALTQSDLDQVEAFYITNKNITSLEGLERCTNIYSIYMENCNLDDISAIVNLKNLHVLGLSGNKNISDISTLATLPNLQTLDLDDNQIIDVTPLKNLTNLTKLDLSNNDIRDISCLNKLVNLWDFRVCENELESINVVVNFNINGPEGGSGIRASGNDIEDISILASMTNVKKIFLADNEIKDISSIVNLTDLQYVDFSSNLIETLPNMPSLCRLTTIVINDNKIVNTEPFNTLPNLNNLYLHNNLVEDLYPLTLHFSKDSSTYRSLRIMNNRLNAISIDTYIQQIKDEGVVVYHD